jgi:dyslexia susceptibility 1 candidate gene 1 protein
MSILVKDYTWRQTENVVVIRVPLKGVHCSKVDIFSSDNYIKVCFIEWLCDCCIKHCLSILCESICL